jgi:hypothetical protein
MKARLEAGSYIMVGHHSALVDPWIPQGLLPAHLRGMVEQGNRPTSEWVRLFEVLAGSSPSDLAKISLSDIQGVHTGKVTFGHMKTPSRKRATESPFASEDTEMYEGLEEPTSKIPRLLLSSGDEAVKVVQAGWNLAVDAVEEIQGDVGAIEKLVTELDARTQVLNARQKVKEAGEAEASSSDSFGGASTVEGVEVSLKELDDKQRTLDGAMYAYKVKTDGLVVSVEENKRSTDAATRLLKLISERWNSPAPHPSELGELKERVNLLAAHLASLEEQARDKTRSGPPRFAARMEGTYDSGAPLSVGGHDGDGETRTLLSEITRKLEVLERRSKAQSWEKGSQSFGTLDEVVQFVKLHMTGIPAPGGGGGYHGSSSWGDVIAPDEGDGAVFTGCFYDIYSAFQRVHEDVEGGSVKLMGDLKRAGMAGGSGGIDAAVIQQSFKVAWPALLHKAGAAGQPLNRLKTIKEWEDRGKRQGVVVDVDNRMETILDAANDAAALEFRNHPQVRDLVSVLNSGVRDFWTRLRSFVNAFHLELLEGSKASSQESWDLIREMIAAVFEEIHKARNIARSVSTGRAPRNLTEQVNQAALIIWGTVQAHRVMAEVQQADFKRHQCVVPSLTLFLFNHRAPTQMVVDLQVKLAMAEKERNGLKGLVDKIDVKVAKIYKKVFP